jgi:hypothetical protein
VHCSWHTVREVELLPAHFEGVVEVLLHLLLLVFNYLLSKFGLGVNFDFFLVLLILPTLLCFLILL